MLTSERFLEIKASGMLPSPQGAALKVIELCGRDDVPLPELLRVLQTDPAMTGKLLKLANSAAFARPRPAASLTPDVLMSLGIQAVRQVVLAFSLVSAYREGACPGFDYGLFWSRSLARGAAAQLLGGIVRCAPAGELFTLGLLAGVGRLALAALHPAAYGEIIARAGDPCAPRIREMETAAFGFDHADVSAALLRDWGLPRLFCDAVMHYEAPEESGFDPASRPGRLVLTLNLAARLAALCFMPEAERRAGFDAASAAGETLGIGRENLPTLADEMLREWAQWSHELDVPAHEVKTFSSLVEAPQATATQAPPADRFSILVVDDDATVRYVLEKLLREAGHEVTLAADGRAGLVEALRIQPDIVITDLMMPHQDGFALIKNLRETELGRLVYIIVVTIAEGNGSLVRALDLGADDYLVKPVDPTVLAARVRAGQRIVREQRLLRHEQGVLRRQLMEVSIAHQRAEDAALTDPLTGLPNRRYLFQRLAQEWAEAERSGRPLSVLMIDVDHFKAINDAHGHEAGDEVLRQLALTLRAALRTPDIVGRFGGEEFLVIAPDTHTSGAARLAERICSAVSSQAFAVNGIALPVTASLGVATRGPATPHLNELISAADQAMYAAKDAGRNCYQSYAQPEKRSPDEA
jgi:diguanylate cyclase (GGDEF)-like protein